MRSSVLYVYSLLCMLLPATRFFGFKRWLLGVAGCDLGWNVRIASSARFQLQGPLRVGADTWIGHDVLVVGGDAPVHIGANCDIAPRVTLATGTHQVEPQAAHVAGKGYSVPITIEDGCWIGAGALILGGTVIRSHSIVAAGAVVRGEFPPRVLIGGVPARVIKSIDALPVAGEH
jgi:acetyltransferase-like isoleucine patch superfamily enzyme